MKQLLSLRQAAEESGLGERTLRRLVDERRIAYIQPSGKGGKVYIEVADLTAFIDEHRQEPITHLPTELRRRLG